MIAALYAAGAGIIAGASFYLAWWHTDACKFLAGAFFMSSVILFYHYISRMCRCRCWERMPS
jgi:hypothetical protein